MNILTQKNSIHRGSARNNANHDILSLTSHSLPVLETALVSARWTLPLVNLTGFFLSILIHLLYTGQRFAIMEEKVVVIQFLRKFKVVSRDEPEDMKLLFQPILHSFKGLFVSVELREWNSLLQSIFLICHSLLMQLAITKIITSPTTQTRILGFCNISTVRHLYVKKFWLNLVNWHTDAK